MVVVVSGEPSSNAVCLGSRCDYGGVGSGLSQACIARRVGRSPSVVYREFARHRGADGVH